ncbi:MAG TPA: NUDIX hydrolase [Opitutaceae bacterium]|nr:NUDIX hydrolase [Opitutaceae bacterium]
MSSNSPGPSRWEKIGHSVQTKTRIFELLSARYRHPVRGTERDFVVVQAPDWVNVVALTADERLVLVRQFRYGIDEFSLEIPGGVMEAGEDPVTAGLRELREETGFTGAPAKLLGSVHPNPAIQSNRCHFVFVEAAVKAHALEWDADEEIHVTTEPVETVLALARSGAITHGLVLDALFMFEAVWRARKGGK